MDKLFINGKFYTQDARRGIVEAVYVKDGRITMTGSASEMRGYINEDTKVVDLGGKAVVPGFNDSHIHLLNYAYSLTKLDCSHVRSVEDMIEHGKAYIRELEPKEGEWVLGRGWNHITFKDQREPNRFDLDEISREHPIVFTRICEHIVAVNSKALEISGIDVSTPQPEGGHFDVDEKGNPTGLFREAARYMIYEKIRPGDKESIKSMLLNAAQIASSYGITSVQSDDFETFADKNYDIILEAYQELIQEKKFPVRVYEQCLLPNPERLRGFLKKGYKTGVGDEFFKIGPLKLLTDGSLGARTAYLHAPYSDDPATSGISVFTQSQLDELVLIAQKGGMQVLTHAIGDGAIDMCLHAFKKAQEVMFKEDPRFGIVHLQITNKQQLEKFREMNIIAYSEPICVNNDLHMAQSRVGENRIKDAYNYRTLADSGVHVTLSSDTPVDSLNPMDSIYVAVTRKDYQGYPEGGWMPEQRLTVDQAVYGFTMESAYASFEEEQKGSIEAGKLADMAVLSQDIYEMEPEKIKDVVVEMTIMNGEIVYRKSKEEVDESK